MTMSGSMYMVRSLSLSSLKPMVSPYEMTSPMPLALFLGGEITVPVLDAVLRCNERPAAAAR